MKNATKRKLRNGIGTFCLLSVAATCLMGMAMGVKDITWVWPCVASGWMVAYFISRVAFGYIQPDPRDAWHFASNALAAAKSSIIEIRVQQLDDAMRLGLGYTKRHLRACRKELKLELQTLSISEIMEQIKTNTPKLSDVG